MPRKRRLEFPGEIHHIMARGLDGMTLFVEKTDKQQLFNYLAKYISSTGCRCYAWALLDTHYQFNPKFRITRFILINI